MDVLSFVLGIGVVVVTIISVVAVIAFVKVNRALKGLDNMQDYVNKEFDSLYRKITNVSETIYKDMSSQIERIDREKLESEKSFNSVLDSRLDKLETKLTSQKA